ncbi:MAG: hypothetical protein WKG00_32890 [Polyangiaceae bacterium]
MSILNPPPSPGMKSMCAPSARRALLRSTRTVSPPASTSMSFFSRGPKKRSYSKPAPTWKCSSPPSASAASRKAARAASLRVTRGGSTGSTGSADAPPPSSEPSSPEASISRTMSQPPTNWPFTYSCGTVGHSENSLMPSRSAGSERTSTVWYSDR